MFHWLNIVAKKSAKLKSLLSNFLLYPKFIFLKIETFLPLGERKFKKKSYVKYPLL